MNDEEAQAKMKEILEHADKQIQTKHTELMQIHHEAMQRLRQVKNELYEFKDRFSNLIDEVIMVHTIAAKRIADLYGDIILAEEGLSQIDEEEEIEDE